MERVYLTDAHINRVQHKLLIMKNRLVSNYVTTIVGLLIMAFCLVMIYTGKADSTDMSGWLAVSLLFLRSKDSLIALPKDDPK